MSRKNFATGEKLQTKHLCERYKVSDRTVDRWVAEGILPQPVRINRYRYWSLDEVESFDRARSQASGAAIKHPST
jgi:DNA-binding transcriptional MerR regulator